MKSKILPIKERLLRNPKAFSITALFLFSVIVTLLSVFLDPPRQYDPNRHQYDLETREERTLSFMSDASLSYRVPQEYLFHYQIIGADVIVAGKVIDTGEVKSYENDEIRYTPPINSTAYQFQVRETWYGECEDTITLRLWGGLNSGVTKPHIGDELILFLFENKQGEYVTVAYEQSMFAINPPDNRIYAFSVQDPLTAFDGDSVSEFRNEVKKALNEFRSIANQEAEETSFFASVAKNGGIGTVGNSVLSNNNPLRQMQPEETE